MRTEQTIKEDQLEELLGEYPHLQSFIENEVARVGQQPGQPHATIRIVAELQRELHKAVRIGRAWRALVAELEEIYGRRGEPSAWDGALYSTIVEVDGELSGSDSYFRRIHDALKETDDPDSSPALDDYNDFLYGALCRACGVTRVPRITSSDLARLDNEAAQLLRSPEAPSE